ncbi:MAG TPA: protein kinase, partial [Kineosporiaceae bacterium]|nr:protein kinase [Kineosporiaceae bacterium]
MNAATGEGQGGWLRPTGDPAAGSPHVPGVVMLRLLGVGGHGEVWLAEDLVSGDQVAVKVRRDQAASLPAPRGEGPRGVGPGDDSADSAQQAAARLNREVALLRRIDHPHVVRLRRVVDLPGGARALVMDHAAGGSLADLVAIRGPLEATEAATLSVPLARTLADLHERGLVHGDLTPSNVLFTADGRPMIADLGCAVVLGDATAEA